MAGLLGIDWAAKKDGPKRADSPSIQPVAAGLVGRDSAKKLPTGSTEASRQELIYCQIVRFR